MITSTPEPAERGTALLRLLQLSSAALPVGAFSYSSGLEAVVEGGDVYDLNGLRRWLWGLMEHTLVPIDLAALHTMLTRVHEGEAEALGELAAWVRAARESAELREQDHVLGRALARLAVELGVAGAEAWRRRVPGSYVAVFALVCHAWGIQSDHALHGYAFAYAENQLQAALKLGVVGQTDTQRLLLEMSAVVPGWVIRALSMRFPEQGASAPGLMMASSAHERQYSRLFRS